MAAAPESSTSASVFQTKYEEYAKELLDVFPEFAAQIRTGLALSPSERLSRFQAEIKAVGSTDTTANPGSIFPGVTVTDEIWKTLSESTQKAIWEYLRLLSMCCFLEAGFSEGGMPDGETKAWMDDMMGQWKEKMDKVDFQGMFGKFAKIFGMGEGGAGDASGGKFKMPELPKKFLKGHLAKLAEEIVRDIKPEDLGMTPEMVEECEKSPSRALTLLVQVFTKNPAVIQNTIKKIGNRLQQKVQTGQIRPQEIAKEAEELMKEFSSNPEFVEVMESLKSMFGFEDMDMARQAGREGSARLSMVQQRLRKKLEAKKAGKK
jgi:hypothetical protein